jgi:Cytochrome c3
MRTLARFPRWLIPLCLSLALGGGLFSQSHKTEVSETTEDRIAASPWWPTKTVADAAQLAGNAECAKCHSDKATTQATTPMAHAGARAADAEILRSHEELTGELLPYRYAIARSATGSKYSVSDGAQNVSAQLEWAFGVAHKGQTYIYSRDGAYYESRVSFYATLQSLALTTGHLSESPTSIDAALGRRMDAGEAQHCFGCHTSGSTIGGRFDASHATPGVSCEQCHGPGAKHVAAMKAGKIEDGRRAILNPRKLSPVASVDFCGACHRTWADVLQTEVTGVANVRFQPYRLESSKCWGSGDVRLACYTCHDPHQPLVTETSSYDSKCLSCHVTKQGEKIADHPGAACPVATSNCASCHMPKVGVPSMHSPFTDHRIRIVRDAGTYPN